MEHLVPQNESQKYAFKDIGTLNDIVLQIPLPLPEFFLLVLPLPIHLRVMVNVGVLLDIFGGTAIIMQPRQLPQQMNWCPCLLSAHLPKKMCVLCCKYRPCITPLNQMLARKHYLILHTALGLFWVNCYLYTHSRVPTLQYCVAYQNDTG